MHTIRSVPSATHDTSNQVTLGQMLDNAKRFYDNQRYQEALSLFEQIDDRTGFSFFLDELAIKEQALNYLGKIYYHGYAGVQDIDKAQRYFERVLRVIPHKDKQDPNVIQEAQAYLQQIEAARQMLLLQMYQQQQ